MPRLTKLIVLALALCGASLLSSGCSTKTEQDNTIPWSRPANWEGGVPGMGGLGGGGYR